MPVVGAVRSGRVNFLERDIWPTTPSVQEFQPNVRVARDPAKTGLDRSSDSAMDNYPTLTGIDVVGCYAFVLLVFVNLYREYRTAVL